MKEYASDDTEIHNMIQDLFFNERVLGSLGRWFAMARFIAGVFRVHLELPARVLARVLSGCYNVSEVSEMQAPLPAYAWDLLKGSPKLEWLPLTMVF